MSSRPVSLERNMKKESYDNPLVEIIDLPDTDVICESGGIGTPIEFPPG